MADEERQRLKVFISYAHEDEGLCQELIKHLALLQREGLLANWSDRKITGGTEWAGQIDEQLEAANIVILLVSSSFISSDYCYDKEMKRALERDKEGKARVIPVILRPPIGKEPFSESCRPFRRTANPSSNGSREIGGSSM